MLVDAWLPQRQTLRVLGVSTNNQYVAIALSPYEVWVVDVSDPSTLNKFVDPGRLGAVYVSDDGRTLLYGIRDGIRVVRSDDVDTPWL